MFTPLAAKPCLEFFGIFKEGNSMLIDDPTLIARAQGREVARVKAGGTVKLTINVTERNMKNHGYVC